MPRPRPSALRHALQLERRTASSTTARPRGSLRCRRRNSTGSTLAAIASSSMKDSMPKMLAKAPSERSDEPDHLRRAVRLPRELVLAAPLQPHGPSLNHARDNRRIERHVVGAVVSIAAGAFGVADDDLFLRHAQHHGDLLAQAEDALGLR